ncbi:PKD domain-containing protein [Pedobacter metabolipauper]|uniref:PKD domain-containing protein n=1 Tax=Pedobacter metabolipauper TaxID=425513 RepID=A0A4R6SQN8_9SPHI|nr:PKD domain-containing protein [Pedobacter metabolipauper]TDQ06356.1 PKD domain-containing protein [Pedobacter metabolipauper]
MKNIYQITLIGLLALTLGCSKNEDIAIVPEEPKPTAKFTVAPVSESDAYTLEFKNASVNGKKIRWTFGDDSVSAEFSPIHTFRSAGTYRVLLSVENGDGYKAQSEIFLKLNPDLLLNFAAVNQGAGKVKLNVSSPTVYTTFKWTFEDKTTSTEATPITTVPAGSVRLVTLEAKTAKGSTATVQRLVTDFGVAQDVTIGSTLIVSKDNNSGAFGGEGSLKLIDNNINTKFLMSAFKGMYAQQVLTTPQVVKVYGITSGDDAQVRDPQQWTLLGSEDGLTWDLLDTRDEQFTGRKMLRLFAVQNTKAYTYYRLNITKNQGNNDLLQISEWRLYKIN